MSQKPNRLSHPSNTLHFLTQYITYSKIILNVISMKVGIFPGDQTA